MKNKIKIYSLFLFLVATCVPSKNVCMESFLSPHYYGSIALGILKKSFALGFSGITSTWNGIRNFMNVQQFQADVYNAAFINWQSNQEKIFTNYTSEAKKRHDEILKTRIHLMLRLGKQRNSILHEIGLHNFKVQKEELLGRFYHMNDRLNIIEDNIEESHRTLNNLAHEQESLLQEATIQQCFNAVDQDKLDTVISGLTVAIDNIKNDQIRKLRERVDSQAEIIEKLKADAEILARMNQEKDELNDSIIEQLQRLLANRTPNTFCDKIRSAAITNPNSAVTGIYAMLTRFEDHTSQKENREYSMKPAKNFTTLL